MSNLQVHWYNKLVDEIVRRYVNDVKHRLIFPSFFHLFSSSERKMNSLKYLKIINDYEVNVNLMIFHLNPSNRSFLWKKSSSFGFIREDVIAKKITGRSVVFPLLRACTHPYLLDAPRDENGEILVNDELISCSGKFLLLDKMLAKLSQTSHKVLSLDPIRRNLPFASGFNLFNFSHFSRSSRSHV